MANFNLNKVILGGRITKELELKQTPQGISVVSFTLAVNRKFKNDTDITDFINCVAWRQTAEFISKYFKKGSSICVIGAIQTRKWEKDGKKQYATEVVVDEANFVDSLSDREEPQEPKEAPTDKPQFTEMSPDDDLPF